MQAYAEFGLNPQIAELGTTKTLKLLPLTEDEREKLLSENDVSSMSTRQLDEAIRKQKQEALKEARQEVQGSLKRSALPGSLRNKGRKPRKAGRQK